MTARERDTGRRVSAIQACASRMPAAFQDADVVSGGRPSAPPPRTHQRATGHINEQRESATGRCAEPLFEYGERVGLPSLCRLAARPQAASPKTKVLTKALTRRGGARRQRPGEIRVFLAAAWFLSFASLILMDDLPPLGELFNSALSSRGRFPPMTWPRTGGAFFEARPRTINSGGGFLELGCAAIRAAAKLVRPASERAWRGR
jgi:hypothetical protein